MRSTDPFLNAHLVDAYVFHIGGRLWPISLRDQMLRGRLVIERAVEQGSSTRIGPWLSSAEERPA